MDKGNSVLQLIVNGMPKNPYLRLIALLWLAACTAVLVFGYNQRHIHDMPVAFVWFLVILGFPAGALAAAVAGIATGGIAMAMNTHYHPFWDELPLWIAAVGVGYWQWFIFLPKEVARYVKRRRNDA